MSYLKLFLAILQIINWVMARMDAVEKAKAMAALWDQKFMERDRELIDEALKARQRIRDQFNADPSRLRDDDGFKRP